MISIDNLTVSFGGWTLFDEVSFLVNPKDRIGLVGKNGAGKTTLLRIITGEQQATSGAVTRNSDCTIGYLPQQMKVADTTTLIDETAKAFAEVIAIENEIEQITAALAERDDYESAEYEQLMHRLDECNNRYHILGGDSRDADIEKTLLGLGFKRSDFNRGFGYYRVLTLHHVCTTSFPFRTLPSAQESHLFGACRRSRANAMAYYRRYGISPIPKE